MSRILVIFASIDGQTALIAQRVAATLERAGHAVTLSAVDAPGIGLAIGDHDGVVLGGGIRFGHHARSLERLVRDNREAIAGRRNAFFSVCLSAGGPGAKPEQARGYIVEFGRRTGWEPAITASFAGALRYTHYGLLTRLAMRLIVGVAGGETDTSRDYEYTDWDAVERFARSL